MWLCYCYWAYRNCKVNAIIFIKIFPFSLTFWVHITCDIFLLSLCVCVFFCCLVPNFPTSNSLFFFYAVVILFTRDFFLWNNFLGMVHVNCKICIKHDSVNSRTYSTVKWQTNRKQNEFRIH